MILKISNEDNIKNSYSFLIVKQLFYLRVNLNVQALCVSKYNPSFSSK